MAFAHHAPEPDHAEDALAGGGRRQAAEEAAHQPADAPASCCPLWRLLGPVLSVAGLVGNQVAGHLVLQLPLIDRLRPRGGEGTPFDVQHLADIARLHEADLAANGGRAHALLLQRRQPTIIQPRHTTELKIVTARSSRPETR